MKSKFLLSVILVFAQVSAVLAHALWIETSETGTKGKVQLISIFYAEYAAKQFEPVDKWYSDVNTFALWLIAPDGKKTQLTYTPADNHFKASFTPDQDGIYTIITGHSAKDIDGGYIYQFNASAQVNVGKSVKIAAANTNTDLYLEPVKDPKGKSGIVKAYFKGQPAAEIDVLVSGPTGWSKTFKTDKNGVLEFQPEWKGAYALEGSTTVDEAGTHFEKPYEHIWRCATVRINL